MIHTKQKGIKEFQAHQGPKELVAHKVPVVHLELQEVLGYLCLASEELLGFQA